MRRRGRTTTRREGWYCVIMALLIFSGAIWRDVNLLLMLSGVVIGPMVFGVHAVRVTLRGLKARRRTPDRVVAGEPMILPIELINPRRRLSLWGVWARQSIERLGGAGSRSRWKILARNGNSSTARRDEALVEVLFPHVPAGQSRVASCSVRLLRRGRYQLGPLRLATSFPFGLFERTIEVADAEEILVYPRIGHLTSQWTQRRRESLLGQCHREFRGGVEGDFLGLRAWRPGDGRRLIDWRASARTMRGEHSSTSGLMVRQFEKPRGRDIALILDLFTGSKKRSDPEVEVAVEKAVAFAATLVEDACREGGGNLLLAAWDEAPSIARGPVSPGLFEEAMTELALVSPTREDRLGELMAEAASHLGRDMEVVVVTIGAGCNDASRQDNSSQGPSGEAGVIDPSRVPLLQGDSATRSLLRSLRVIDVTGPDFDRFVRFEDTSEANELNGIVT